MRGIEKSPTGTDGLLTVVCPVYNEAENIGHLMDQLAASISVPLELLVVYDQPDDSTIPAVEKIASRYPFETRLVKNTFGSGALNAIKTGFAESQGEAVLVVMADLSDDLSAVNEMHRLITTEGFDIVCGSRYMSGGRQIGGPVLKKFFSLAIGLSLHYLTGLPVHDVTNSFKMYRRQFLNDIKIESSGGFEIGMELVVKGFINGNRITELPATWRDRTAGESRFKIRKWAPHYFRWYLYALGKSGQRKKGGA